MSFPDVGTGQRVDEVLAQYPGLESGLFANETDALLAALLIEQQGQRIGSDPSLGVDRDPDQVGATYHSEAFTATSSSWYNVTPGFVSNAVDLRFTEPVVVAYTADQPPENNDDKLVSYAANDSPVPGVSVHTGNVWVKAQEADSAVSVEVYRE